MPADAPRTCARRRRRLAQQRVIPLGDGVQELHLAQHPGGAGQAGQRRVAQLQRSGERAVDQAAGVGHVLRAAVVAPPLALEQLDHLGPGGPGVQRRRPRQRLQRQLLQHLVQEPPRQPTARQLIGGQLPRGPRASGRPNLRRSWWDRRRPRWGRRGRNRRDGPSPPNTRSSRSRSARADQRPGGPRRPRPRRRPAARGAATRPARWRPAPRRAPAGSTTGQATGTW